VDIRTVPQSARNPQFKQEQLSATLPASGIGYLHMPGLGGFRRPRIDSPNTGWRNLSFREYADYMQTDDFTRALDDCTALAARERLVLMCAEAVPWRCHRSLVADAMIVRGIEAREISSASRTRLHTLTPFARVNGTQVTYPPPASG
jgi:uncharacterized protein (DUF488 family)